MSEEYTRRHFLKFAASIPALKVIGGHSPVKPFHFNFRPTNSHTIIIGPTGAGKGVGFVIPKLFESSKPIIIIDVKGEYIL